MANFFSFFLLLVFTCCFFNSFAESRKELRTKEANQEAVIQLGGALLPNTIDPSRVTELSWRPRVFLYKGFLSDEECDHLISLGYDDAENSSGNNSRNAMELSTELDISKEIEDKIASMIEERISAWTFLPKGNGKPFQILHFGPEEAKHNYDYFGNTSIELKGESVMATVVLYLSNVTHGGQILFPEAEPSNKMWSDCQKSSEKLRPTKGNAILFFSLHPNASLDTSSSHARCPVLEGDMWWAAKIFTVKHTTIKENLNFSESENGDLCTDEDENCPRWAAIGECERNPVFMVGSSDYYGTCRKSCNAC